MVSATTNAGVSALATLADGVFVSGDDAGTVVVWNTGSATDGSKISLRAVCAKARAHEFCVTAIACFAGNEGFVTVGADARLNAWDTQRATSGGFTCDRPVVAVAGAARGAVHAVATHQTDKNLIATAGDDGAVRVWDLRHPQSPVASREGNGVRTGVGRAYALAWAGVELGEALAVGYESGAVCVLETRARLGDAAGGTTIASSSLETRGVVEAHGDAVRGLAWETCGVKPGNPRLASCGDDGQVATHEGELPVTKRNRPHGESYARCVSFWEDPGDGVVRLVSGGWDGRVVAA